MKGEEVKLFSITARNPKQFGHALKRYRIRNKLTQSEVSEKSGVRQANISQIENGHGGVKLETMFKVLLALDLEVIVRKRRKSLNRMEKTNGQN